MVEYESIEDPIHSQHQHPPPAPVKIGSFLQPQYYSDTTYDVSAAIDTDQTTTLSTFVRHNHESISSGLDRIVSHPEPASSLGLSDIRPSLFRSPQAPIQAPKQQFSGSLGPQSGDVSLTTTAADSSSLDCNDLAKYKSAFEYAMRPLSDDLLKGVSEIQTHLPPLTLQEAQSDAASPLMPCLGDDQISFASESKNSNSIPEYGTPTYLKKKYSFRTHIQLIQLRNLLMQCAILLPMAHETERKPWVVNTKRPPSWYYSKIRRLAYKARSFAECLESQDLLARCEYWLGRGCGGTRDYQAAMDHFKLAIKLDIENELHTSGRPVLRGLRPAEKADVHFLLGSASDRYEDWMKRTAHDMNLARQLPDASGIPVEVYLHRTAQYSPLWMPDRDRVIELARVTFDVPNDHNRPLIGMCQKSTSGEINKLEDAVGAQWKVDDEQVRKMIRKSLSRREWHYIHHGDTRIAAQSAR